MGSLKRMAYLIALLFMSDGKALQSLIELPKDKLGWRARLQVYVSFAKHRKYESITNVLRKKQRSFKIF